MNKGQQLQAMCYNAALRAIRDVGMEEFKKTSLFARNQRRVTVKKAA